jgi:hypothetical protein
VTLTYDDVTRIAREGARAASPSLQVVGVTLGGSSDSEYVEILINIDGCSSPPCQVELGVFRNLPEAQLRDEVTRKLRDHLERHRS